jgi:uncharacterized small protein (DUF1192 family)
MQDDEPRARFLRMLEPKQLDPMSEEDLNLYIEALRAEIARAEAVIAFRHEHRRSADQFFKKG